MGKGGIDPVTGNLTYGGYTPTHTPTHGKPCGLKNNDELLGNHYQSKWNFAKFTGGNAASAKENKSESPVRDGDASGAKTNKPKSPIKNGAVVAFKNVGTGTCIDLSESNPANGTPVIGFQYNATKNQQWKLEQVGATGKPPVYMIRNRQTMTCLDLKEGGRSNGTPIVGWKSSGTSNDHQLWRFIAINPNDPSIVMIQNVGTSTYLDLYNGEAANSTKIVGWAGGTGTNVANTHQQWKVETV